MMSTDRDNSEKNISRRDFMKLMGASSLFVGLGVLGIPNVLKNLKASAGNSKPNID